MIGAALSFGTSALATEGHRNGHDGKDFLIETLSTKPHLISGGNVLVRVQVPHDVSLRKVDVELNGKDVTSRFRVDPHRRTLTGLVQGLKLGRNQLKVSAGEGKHGRRSETLALTNYPITGPIISGPHQQPFICQTESFQLPDGTTFGAPFDANCSAPTKVSYVYTPIGGRRTQADADLCAAAERRVRTRRRPAV